MKTLKEQVRQDNLVRQNETAERKYNNKLLWQSIAIWGSLIFFYYMVWLALTGV